LFPKQPFRKYTYFGMLAIRGHWGVWWFRTLSVPRLRACRICQLSKQWPSSGFSAWEKISANNRFHTKSAKCFTQSAQRCITQSAQRQFTFL